MISLWAEILDKFYRQNCKINGIKTIFHSRFMYCTWEHRTKGNWSTRRQKCEWSIRKARVPDGALWVTFANLDNSQQSSHKKLTRAVYRLYFVVIGLDSMQNKYFSPISRFPLIPLLSYFILLHSFTIRLKRYSNVGFNFRTRAHSQYWQNMTNWLVLKLIYKQFVGVYNWKSWRFGLVFISSELGKPLEEYRYIDTCFLMSLLACMFFSLCRGNSFSSWSKRKQQNLRLLTSETGHGPLSKRRNQQNTWLMFVSGMPKLILLADKQLNLLSFAHHSSKTNSWYLFVSFLIP